VKTKMTNLVNKNHSSQ